jgi:hypothetical protein
MGFYDVEAALTNLAQSVLRHARQYPDSFCKESGQKVVGAAEGALVRMIGTALGSELDQIRQRALGARSPEEKQRRGGFSVKIVDPLVQETLDQALARWQIHQEQRVGAEPRAAPDSAAMEVAAEPVRRAFTWLFRESGMVHCHAAPDVLTLLAYIDWLEGELQEAELGGVLMPPGSPAAGAGNSAPGDQQAA